MLTSMSSILSKNTNLSSSMSSCSLKMIKLANANTWSKSLFIKGNSRGISTGGRSFQLNLNLSRMVLESLWTLRARSYRWALSRMVHACYEDRPVRWQMLGIWFAPPPDHPQENHEHPGDASGTQEAQMIYALKLRMRTHNRPTT